MEYIDKNSYKCYFCINIAFINYDDLQKHIFTYHEDMQKHKCHSCDQKFDQYSLKIHHLLLDCRSAIQEDDLTNKKSNLEIRIKPTSSLSKYKCNNW